MILVGNFYALNSENRLHSFAKIDSNKSRKQNIRPNVHDIKRFLKPIVTPPSQAYIPTEVDSLQDINKMSDDGN
jgi:hypothetical protein